jgi:hypothetical protein
MTGRRSTAPYDPSPTRCPRWASTRKVGTMHAILDSARTMAAGLGVVSLMLLAACSGGDGSLLGRSRGAAAPTTATTTPPTAPPPSRTPETRRESWQNRARSKDTTGGLAALTDDDMQGFADEACRLFRGGALGIEVIERELGPALNAPKAIQDKAAIPMAATLFEGVPATCPTYADALFVGLRKFLKERGIATDY